MNKIKVVGFDADDTLWVNEPYYQNTEKAFCGLLQKYLSAEEISKELYQVEMKNLELYGYGAKSFILSMIETALNISNNNISSLIIEKIIEMGKSLIDQPVELLGNVESVLQILQKKYRLIIATKGDILDQYRKLKKSKLQDYFHHIEIMNEKKADDYMKIIKFLEIKPEEFLMIGNSMKSDILPVIAIGGQAIHIPFHTTWEHEKIDVNTHKNQYREISGLKELIDIL